MQTIITIKLSLSHNIFRELSRHFHPFPSLIIPGIQFISVQIVLDEVFQMQVIIIFNLKFQNIVLIIGFLTWMNIARIVRGETISLNEREYVIYAKISGQKKFSTIVHHILPNIMPTIIVAATMNIANAILMESALSFFGLGIQPPTASWGSMLSNAQRYIQQAPHLAVFPGLLILITVISFNYLGEVLRKVFEPK